MTKQDGDRVDTIDNCAMGWRARVQEGQRTIRARTAHTRTCSSQSFMSVPQNGMKVDLRYLSTVSLLFWDKERPETRVCVVPRVRGNAKKKHRNNCCCWIAYDR